MFTSDCWDLMERALATHAATSAAMSEQRDVVSEIGRMQLHVEAKRAAGLCDRIKRLRSVQYVTITAEVLSFEQAAARPALSVFHGEDGPPPA